MASVLFVAISFIGCLVTSVASQMDIVNVKKIVDSDPFTVTCNAQRVVAASTNFSTIACLQIHVLNPGAQDYSLVAQYLTLAPPGVSKEFQNPPAGRQWIFNYNGSNAENGGANNKASMEIEIQVPDGKHEDAGWYNCTVVYYNYIGILTTVSREQFVTVASQRDIVSVNTIYDYRPFTITCDARRVNTSSANFSSIDSLQIQVLNQEAQDYRLLAQYLTFAPPGVGKEFQNPPAGRDWIFNFSGSNSENGGSNNKASMKIEIQVPDGKSEDAGVYRCSVAYYNSVGTTTVSREQVVTVAYQQDIVSVNTIEKDRPFTITCDTRRANNASSSNFPTIRSLQIDVLSNGSQYYRQLARYSFYTSDTTSQNPPAGRDWIFNFSGSNSENGNANNKASMKIEIQVPDGKPEDAGVYRCSVFYTNSVGGQLKMFREQNVTAGVQL